MVVKEQVRTRSHEEFIDISSIVADAVKTSGVIEGRVTVFIPHTTAAVTINENADPTVREDFEYFFSK